MAGYSDYDPFAWIYNKYWAPGSAQRFLPVLEKLVQTHLPAKARILDLCCGTGQLAQALLARGYQVTGLDGSEEMIHYARANVPDGEFFVADARKFHLPAAYRAVVSTYDSLNHILNLEELSQVFHNVHACLQAEGLFLFDLNMEEGYQSRWRGSFGIVEDDHVCVVRPSYQPDERKGQYAVTIFRLEGDMWHRSDVTLLQKCYSEEEVRSSLKRVGFAEIRTYDAQQDLGWSQDRGRTFYLCRKAREGGGG